MSSFFGRKKDKAAPAGQVTVTTTPSQALAQLSGPNKDKPQAQYDPYVLARRHIFSNLHS